MSETKISHISNISMRIYVWYMWYLPSPRIPSFWKYYWNPLLACWACHSFTRGLLVIISGFLLGLLSFSAILYIISTSIPLLDIPVEQLIFWFYYLKLPIYIINSVNISKVFCENLKCMTKLPGVETTLMPPQDSICQPAEFSHKNWLNVFFLHFKILLLVSIINSWYLKSSTTQNSPFPDLSNAQSSTVPFPATWVLGSDYFTQQLHRLCLDWTE